MIKYYLTKLAEGTFVFQIEEQEDRLTSYIKSRPGGYYPARNGWKVAIDKEPAVDTDTKTIYLRGSDVEADENVSRHWGLNPKECKNIMRSIDDAILEAVEAAKNWKVKHVPTFVEVVEIHHGYDPFGPFYGLPGVIVIKDRR